jgi:hypothetical protein
MHTHPPASHPSDIAVLTQRQDAVARDRFLVGPLQQAPLSLALAEQKVQNIRPTSFNGDMERRRADEAVPGRPRPPGGRLHRTLGVILAFLDHAGMVQTTPRGREPVVIATPAHVDAAAALDQDPELVNFPLTDDGMHERGPRVVGCGHSPGIAGPAKGVKQDRGAVQEAVGGGADLAVAGQSALRKPEGTGLDGMVECRLTRTLGTG